VGDTVRANVSEVRERIDRACSAAGRSPDDVTIVGVTKTFGPEVVDRLIEAGIGDIGESRIQEFLDKRDAVTRRCRWHLIGHLQRNKAGKAVGQFDLVHSVDSLRLAETLSRMGADRGLSTRVLLEVNTSGEPTKHGFAPDELEGAAIGVMALPAVSLEGLMTVGPFTDDAGEIRRAFALLRDLRGRAERSTGRSLAHLSMGMSDDFEIAVEEGATMVRLGRILLGSRGTPPVQTGG
jgi:pyridoxal phosphate enzyme (YggS family)